MSNTKRLHIVAQEEGFTLVEAMIAVFVLTIGIFSLYTMHIATIKGNATANHITSSADFGSSWVERIFGMPWDDPDLIDTTGDGLAGLDKMTALEADHSQTSSDGFYTVYWNIADDEPLPGLKRIRVIVTRNDYGVSKSLVMNYVKSEFVK